MKFCKSTLLCNPHWTTYRARSCTLSVLRYMMHRYAEYWRGEFPESYCRNPGVGIRVRVRMHKNFNVAYNSWTIIGRAFIFHMCIPFDKTFPLVPFRDWLSPASKSRYGWKITKSTLILKTTNQSIGTKIFDLVTFTLKFELLLNNFNLGHSFLTRRDRAIILYMYIPCDKIFPLVPNYFTLWPWPCEVWPTLKKTLTLAIAS